MADLIKNSNTDNETDKPVKKGLSVSAVYYIISLALLYVLILLFGFPGITQTVTSFKSGFALDTVVNITVYDGGSSDIAARMFDLCDEYESKYFSPTKETSELYKINHIEWTQEELINGSVKTIELSKHVYDVFDLAYYSVVTDKKYNTAISPVSELWDFHDVSKAVVPDEDEIRTALNMVGELGTDYDIAYGYEFEDGEGNTVEYEYALILKGPCTFDFGSVAKGYIADQIKDYAVQNGVTSAIIDLGGNICCIGSKLSGGLFKKKFNIQIDTSFLASNDELLTVRISDKSAVTSGKYQRYFDKDGKHYHHILDSTTGYPVETDLASVTIIGESSGVCDALSTVCFIVGEEKSLEILEKTGYDALFIYDDGKVHKHLKK